jgi:hypothetical protein
MTPASEIVVRWYFTENDVEEHYIDDIVSTLYDGYAAKNDDAREFLERILALSASAEKSAPWDFIVDTAILIHESFQHEDMRQRNLTSVQTILDTLRTLPDFDMGKRVSLSRIKSCLEQITL